MLLNDVHAQRLVTDNWTAPTADQNLLLSVLIVGTAMREIE